MDASTREAIKTFLAQYDTLALATEHEGQPYVTRVFYVEEPVQDTSLTLYGTFITTSRKLANLRQNPRVGLFIGPSEPTAWLEATAIARVISDESASAAVREKLGVKSSVAAAFIARVPIVVRRQLLARSISCEAVENLVTGDARAHIACDDSPGADWLRAGVGAGRAVPVGAFCAGAPGSIGRAPGRQRGQRCL